MPLGRLCLALAILPLSASVTWAQAPAANSKAQARALHREAAAEARGLAKDGNLAAAEEALGRLSPARAGTGTWHFDVAQRLTGIASELSRAAKPAEARAAANRALHHLNQAERRTTEENLKIAIQQQIGFLTERYLGDHEGAKAAYRAAAQRGPNKPSVREKAQQIEQTEAIARRREGR